ncbi:MAG: PGF-pre-PGF domain-containing protein [Candidatus Aenigmarchaeota archaeon]|nr:PGF-pre-PGF domain-containing protein [Candidatus Aenigmarchaeota archaeon]
MDIKKGSFLSLFFQKRVLIVVFLVFALSVSVVSAVGTGDIPGRWDGTVTIDESNLTSTAVVDAYLDGTLASSATVGSGFTCEIGNCSNYYLIHVAGSNGTNVTFKVNGVNVSQSAQAWSASRHPLNLNMTTLAAGNACSYNRGCNSSYCSSDFDGAGAWCVASTSCAHDSTTYTNTQTVCSSTTVLQTCSSGTWSSTTCTGSCSAGACVSTGSSGTSSGGGASSVVSETKTITQATETAPATAVISEANRDELKIQEVSIAVTTTQTNVQVIVKESSKPAGAADPVTTTSSGAGNNYKYIDISSNIQSSNIKNVKIKFEVAKSWITANNIDQSKIYLMRYSANSQQAGYNNGWAKLGTTKLSENSTHVFYEAESPGLSTFAITGEKAATGKLACIFDCCAGEADYTDKACGTGYECKERKCAAISSTIPPTTIPETPTPSQQSESPVIAPEAPAPVEKPLKIPMEYVYGVIFIIILAVLAWWYYKHPTKK